MGIASMLTAATSCQFDHTDIWNEMEQIKDRIETLEEAVIKTNEDIVALQAIVNALQKSVYVLAEVDLSELGAVAKVRFNFLYSDEMGGRYGFTIPGYFAYDDVAVRFDK